MKNRNIILTILAFCIVVFLCYVLHSNSYNYEKFDTLTTSSTTTQAPTTTQPTPTSNLFNLTPYNTQYLSNIKNQLNDGYSMMNNNRYSLMDNQNKLDTLNTRVNKLLDNINKLVNISNKNNPAVNPGLTWY